jgi:hypothetical protein
VHALLDALEILGRERCAAREVVVKAVLDRGSDRDLSFGIQLLHGLGHDVRRIVTQQLEPVRRRPSDDLDTRVALDRQRKVLESAVDSNRDGIAFQARANAACNGATVDGCRKRTL